MKPTEQQLKDPQWVSESADKHCKGADMCWVLMPNGRIDMMYFNDYKILGGSGNCWQDFGGTDYPLDNTKFIRIDRPAAPETNDE